MNILVMDGVTYKLIEDGVGLTENPSVIVNGKHYIGEKITLPKDDIPGRTASVGRKNDTTQHNIPARRTM